MRKAAEMLQELNKMEFWVEVDNCVYDSNQIEFVLQYLLEGKLITVGVYKDFRNTSVSQNGFDATQFLK